MNINNLWGEVENQTFEERVPKRRVAILIADSELPFFKKIKMNMAELQSTDHSKYPVDIFYASGSNIYKIRTKLSHKTESMRYSKLWPLKYIFDFISNSKYRKKMPKITLKGQQLEIDCPEGLSFLGIKMLASYDFLHKSGYDFVFRTTLSSFIHYESLMKNIEQLPMFTPTYAGALINFNEHPFISGAATLLNRPTMKILLEKQSQMNFARVDDVEFGRQLEGVVEPTTLKHLNVDELDVLNSITDEEISEAISIRCASKREPRKDAIIAVAVSKRIKSLDR